MNLPPKYDRKKKLPALFSFPSFIFVIKSLVHENINEKKSIAKKKICVHFSLAFFLCLFLFSLLDLH